MDESKCPGKSGKQSSHPRGAKPFSNERSNKEAPAVAAQSREGGRTLSGVATTRQDMFPAGKDDHSVGKAFKDTVQDKRRGRPPRLSRPTAPGNSGEQAKGKPVGSQHHLLAKASDARLSTPSADDSPSASRELSSPALLPTPQRAVAEPLKAPPPAVAAKEKSHGNDSLVTQTLSSTLI